MLFLSDPMSQASVWSKKSSLHSLIGGIIFAVWLDESSLCFIGGVKPLFYQKSQVYTLWSEESSLRSNWMSQASVWSNKSSLHCLIGGITFAVQLDESCLRCLISRAKPSFPILRVTFAIWLKGVCLCCLIGEVMPLLSECLIVWSEGSSLRFLIRGFKSLMSDWKNHAFVIW